MSSSDAYFSKSGTMFKPNTMAGAVSENVAVGPDNDFWVYQTKPTKRDPRVGVWVSDPEVVDRRVSRILRDKYMLSRGSTVERLVRHMDSTRILRPEEPEAWGRYINLQGAMYDWQENVEEEHHPDFRSMIQLPILYDADAKCPKFQSWLDEVVPEDAQQLVWEVLGYALMTGNPLQQAILLLGPEGTGKSTFLRVLERMLGRNNISAQSLKSLTENRFSAASLYGKSANIVGDIDASFMNDTSLFLQITGGDTMTAEYKGKTAFEFSPFALPIFSTNKVWQSANTSGAYFRRWTILPFEVKVDRSKPFDEQALLDEAPGIFNKAMDALRDMYTRTVPDHEGNDVPARYFEVRGAAREARERFARDSDPIREWMDEDEQVRHDAGNESLRIPRTILYSRYNTWCDNNGIRRPKSGPEFYKAVRALGFKEVKSNGTLHFIGIYAYVPGTVPA